MTSVRNPVLRGFNPDPCIIRVDDDYYIATSTFEWYPGVQFAHSRELVNLRVVSRPLELYSHINFRGRPSSCALCAPALTYVDGRFHHIFTDVRTWAVSYTDVHNSP